VASLLVAGTIFAAVATTTNGAIGAWCRDILDSSMLGPALRTLPLAILSVSILSAGLALAKEIRGVLQLRRVIARRRMPVSSKVLAVNSSLQSSSARILQVQDTRPFAYAFGILQPSIVLSSGLVSVLTLHELKLVLQHEVRHANGRHPLQSLMWELACKAFFFLPILRDLSNHFAVVRELNADQDALQVSGRRKSLASALFKITTHGRAFPVSVSAFGMLKERIDALNGAIGVKILLGWKRVLISSATFMALLAVSLSPAMAEARDPTDSACREAIVRTVRIISGPMSVVSSSEPSSTEGGIQSTEIAP
jgi:Zn-dependent protease with chaperone function